MRKLILSLTALWAMTFAISSCSDKDNDNDVVTPETKSDSTVTKSDQFLVMFYGVGGKNLDEGIVGNILQSLCAGSSDKVKMTYQYRFSKKFQDKGGNYADIRRFTADENSSLKGKFNAIDGTTGNEEFNLSTWQSVKSESFGSDDYVMASDTALTSFIKWSKAQYPNASKTILIISDHGGAWELNNDGAKDMSTRAILYDDNTTYSDGSSFFLSVDDVVDGIKNAGKVDALYDDACLMSTWENLTGYAQTVNYFIGSQEIAPGMGGNYYYLISRLNANKATDEGLLTAMKGYCDDVIDKWWPLGEEEGDIYGDLAVYDLQKIDAPLNIIANINKALVEKWNSTETIPGISENVTYGNYWKNYIRVAIQNCEVATNYVGAELLDASKIPEPLIAFLEKVLPSEIYNSYIVQQGKVFAPWVLYALQHVDLSTYNYDEEWIANYEKLWTAFENATSDSYNYADILRVLNAELDSAGISASDNPFVSYRSQYMQALKQFGYIRCTHTLDASRAKQLGMESYEYDTCSPDVFIYPLNAESYNKENEFSKRYSKYIPDVNTAISYYKHTIFDQKASWSSLLQIIDVMPSIIYNPVRDEIK